jgi:hypothetical protein
MAQARTCRVASAGGLLGVLVVACAVVLLLAGEKPLPSRLLEVDGIELDPHAAAELSGGGDGDRGSAISVKLSHMNGKNIDKLLKDNEKGEIDGIALDRNAMAELHGSSAHLSHVSHAAKEKAKASSRAQRLLDEGKEDLDSRRWKTAVKLFARAKRIWKRNGNDFYHWADSLEHDVLRMHPSAAPSRIASHVRQATAGHGQSSVRRAVKQLSTGHQFRSLYGLLRDQHAMSAAHDGEVIAQKAVAKAKELLAPYRSLNEAPARTQDLAQVKGKGAEIDAAVAKAEKELEQKGKMELLHEKAQIVKMARKLARDAAAKAAQNEVRLGAPPAALVQGRPQIAAAPQLAQENSQSWSSTAVPTGERAQWSLAHDQAPETAGAPAGKPIGEYVQQQNAEMAHEVRGLVKADEAHLPIAEQVRNALMRRLPAALGTIAPEQPEPTSSYQYGQTPYERFHRRGRFHFDLDQKQPRYPSAAAPFPPQPEQEVERAPSSPLEMREQVSGDSKVPVVNINLPHGQVVPPGQYLMDGSLVQDLAGHWDYVGKLVPTSPRESAV